MASNSSNIYTCSQNFDIDSPHPTRKKNAQNSWAEFVGENFTALKVLILSMFVLWCLKPSLIMDWNFPVCFLKYLGEQNLISTFATFLHFCFAFLWGGELVDSGNPLGGRQVKYSEEEFCSSYIHFSKDLKAGSNNPTPRIPNSYCCCSSSVTKSVKWRYLGNQAWYHRSAGVKTTGKNSE